MTQIINKKLISLVFFSIIFGVFCFGLNMTFASSTDGTIDSTYKYAWGENTGWIDFSTSNGDVHVTDSVLSGYALSETVGWINLDDVANDGEGNLSGYAWSENSGFIKFNPTNGGVVINSSGEFTGSALGENTGWIIFDGDYTVKTDWRPRSTRPACNNATDDDGDGKTDYPADPGCSSLTDTDETDPRSESSGSRGNVIPNLTANVADESVSFFESLVPDFLKKKPEITSTVKPSQEESLSLANSWDYLDDSLVKNFILAPLPSELAVFIKKYPDLGKIFTKLGVSTVADLDKLKGAVVSLPPITNLKDIPREVLVAKGRMGKIDITSYITLDDAGGVEQKIQTISSTALTLAVKPSGPVDSVNGYLLFKEGAKRKTVMELPFSPQTASVILALQGTSSTTPNIPDRELLVQTFSYEDSDNDGVYTADIKTPAVEGTYEVITLINYTDKTLGSKELRLVTVVDPEGYVYYLTSNGDEARVSRAVISIFNADTDTLWDALSYNQVNPQTTDASGKYSFLVPEGRYYITAERQGYSPYKSDIFEVRSGLGVHFNIELQGSGYFAKLDLMTVILILIILIIVSSFIGYAIHEHALKRKLLHRS